ncbi:Transcriptional regulator [Pseudomonas marginalis]
MQAGEAGFANRVQAGYIGTPMLVDHHAAAGVVRRRHHRDRAFGDVDVERQAALVDGREVGLDERFGLVADVQVDAVDAQALHFMVDGAGDNIPWSQLGARVETLHEALTIGQLEVCTFAAQGFGDQEALGLWVIKAGGVELVEFQVGHPAARAPCHGNAVAAGAVGVAGIEVDLGGAAGGEDGEARTISIHFAAGAVEHIGAEAAFARQAQALFGDQVDSDALFQQFDVGALAGLVEQGPEDRGTGGIGGVDDTAMAVAAFAGQMELEAAVIAACVFIAGEGHALVDQPLDRLAAMLDGEAHRVFVAQAAAGVEGVFNVGLHRIGVVQHRGDTALGPECRTVGQVAFAQDGNAQVAGKGQRKAQAGRAAADHQDIVLKLLAHLKDSAKSDPQGWRKQDAWIGESKGHTGH